MCAPLRLERLQKQKGAGGKATFADKTTPVGCAKGHQGPAKWPRGAFAMKNVAPGTDTAPPLSRYPLLHATWSPARIETRSAHPRCIVVEDHGI
ncbi:unnamed protein product [Lampetra fluviatilis]